MSNIDFIENLVRRFQPGLLGPQEDNSPLAGDIYGAPTAPQLPSIGITGREPNTAFDAPALALPAIAPDGAPNKYAGLVNSIDQLPTIAPGQAAPSPNLPVIAGTGSLGNPPDLPPVTTPTDTTVAVPDTSTPTISPVLQAEQQRLSDLFAKDYSPGQYRRPDGSITSHPTTNGVPNEVVQAPGKDRAKKWSLASKIGNALEGWATGGLAEGIRGATDRNYQAKLKDQSDIARLLPQISAQQQIEARNAATAGAIARPAIARDELQRKAALDANRAKYWEGVLAARKDRLDLSKDQLADLTTYRQSLIANGAKQTDAKIKQIDEVIRHNQVTEKQAVTNEQGRNARAKTSQAAMDRRQQITIAAQKEAAAIRAAEAKGNAADAQAARERLLKLKQQYESEGTQ